MERIVLLKLAVAVMGGICVLADLAIARLRHARFGIAHFGLAALATANVIALLALCANHLTFPLNLDLMESVVLQHAERAAAFEPIYPAPSPEFVPLAYNVLYYLIAIPFVKVFGATLVSLRLLSIAGLVGSGAVIFIAVRRLTRSAWWGGLALGVFAAAYRAMDVYLDTAHSDSWLLCAALTGTCIIDLRRSKSWDLAGLLILIAAFWFKQHGALFVLGGVVILTARYGFRKAWPFWVATAFSGPILYVVAGPVLFGSHFHYFTWEVPRQWTELNRDTIVRYTVFITATYPVLACAGVRECVRAFLRRPIQLGVWNTQGVFAGLSGFMGALDPGSSDNVFIPMGAWCIVLGMAAIAKFSRCMNSRRHAALGALAVFAVFATLAYNPLKLLVPRNAPDAYHDLIAVLKTLDGPVYAPSLGQLPDGFTLQPAAHWVAVEDMLRGPGRDTRDHPEAQRLLNGLLNPQPAAPGTPPRALHPDEPSIRRDGARVPLSGEPLYFGHRLWRTIHRLAHFAEALGPRLAPLPLPLQPGSSRRKRRQIGFGATRTTPPGLPPRIVTVPY